jgi:hypothetical protein
MKLSTPPEVLRKREDICIAERKARKTAILSKRREV